MLIGRLPTLAFVVQREQAGTGKPVNDRVDISASVREIVERRLARD